jgi:hypothetical protein
MEDKFREGADPKSKATRVHLLKNGLLYDTEKYEYKEDFVAADPSKPLEAHTTAEMIAAMERDDKIQLDARVCGMDGDRRVIAKMNRQQFLEAAKRRDSKKFRESIDTFQMDDTTSASRVIGADDFVPMLGGPFNKQLYYRDYLRMISACFYAYHHDPVARAVVSILVDFTMGRGFQLHTDNPGAQALWNAFVEVNGIHAQMDHCAMETSIYGETMWWWLPNNQARVSFNPRAGEIVPKAVIPRIRLIDPSNIAEIITVPEDMVAGVLAYVWMAPTQSQMYTRDNQPSTKFIYQQIPADEIIHEKVNAVSNEKRGRSDYFPALGYMKRLRDGVNYALVGQQKAAAWCIDTVIEGDDADLAAYVAAQQALGDIPTAGSEFVHSKAIERKYLSNSATKAGADSPVFSWCLNMICMASGIPVSYLGTHLSGGSTRASALVATEPVVKRFERRQLVYERIIRKIFTQLMEKFNIQDAECDIVFPELLTQDRSSLLRDLTVAQSNSWMKHSRCAEMAAREFGVKDFIAKVELEDIKKEDSELGITPAQSLGIGAAGTNPLTTPGASSHTQPDKGKSLTSGAKKTVKDNLKTL